VDLELVVEPEHVLLDGRLGHEQLRGDLPDRGGFGVGGVRQDGPTQGGKHVALAGREPGNLLLGHPSFPPAGGENLTGR